MASTEPPPSGERRGWARTWLGRVALVLLGLLLAELFLRAGLALAGRPYSAQENAGHRAKLVHDIAGFLPLVGVDDPVGFVPEEGNGDRFLHPYTGWESFGSFDVLDAELRRPPSEDTYDIWVVGGSVATMFADPDLGGAPHLLARLGADPRFEDRPPRIVNFAKGAFKQPQQLHEVLYLLELLPAPDLLVNLDGFNEVAIGNQNASLGVHPIYPAPIQWSTLARTVLGDLDLFDDALRLRTQQQRAERWNTRFERWGVDHSAALGYGARRFLILLRTVYGRAHVAYAEALGATTDQLLRGPHMPNAPAVLERCVQIWEDSSRFLHAALESRGVAYLHVLQPTLHDEGSKPLTDQERATGGAIDEWIEGVRDGYPLLREAGARLAAGGVPFLDASLVFRDRPGTIYVDSCHFRHLGNGILAEAIAAHLLR